MYQLRDDETERCFIGILKDIGVDSEDVVHFNNLEGVPVDVLRIIKDVYNIKIVVSAHNYYIICPQVNLWTVNNCNCEDFGNGRGCIDCVGLQDSDSIKKDYSIKYSKDGVFGYIDRTLARWKRSIDKRKQKIERLLGLNSEDFNSGCVRVIENDNKASDKYFKLRRKYFVDSINNYSDVVLCVSDRVKDILSLIGVRENKLIVSYIGTDQYRFYKKQLKERSSKRFAVAYMGYMRQDKGFYFLLEALENIPFEISKKHRFSNSS